MKKKRIISIGVALIMMSQNGVDEVNAQTSSAGTNDYNKFREELLQSYSSFKKSVYDDYDKFLEGVWRDYDAAKGFKPDDTPKPKTPPTVKPKDPIPEPVVVNPILPDVKPETPTPEVVPKVPSIPDPVPAPIVVNKDMLPMQFYGAKLMLNACSYLPRLASTNKDDIAMFWRTLKNTDVANSVDLIANANRLYAFNDWCMFQIVKNYSERLYPGSESEQLLTQHLLMTGLGYDVRIALCNGEVCLLLPYQQMVYNSMYVQFNDVKYYVYPVEKEYTQLSSCDIPKECDAGKVIDLNFNRSVNLPNNDVAFKIAGGGLTIQGSVNKNLIELLSTMPLMEIPQYARARPDMTLRGEVVAQLKKQVKGMTNIQAANAIITLVQKGFKYMYDIDQFGQNERPLFFEETIFYPACDCEDRSIFFSYLIKEVLNLDVHLINYPGHEATAIAFNDTVVGTYYMADGRRFVISDPTYIGAKIGECMPNFRTVSPTIEKWY
ncbi:MAG: hypothetical protein RR706_02835 [Muribaculaceae bacterium]